MLWKQSILNKVIIRLVLLIVIILTVYSQEWLFWWHWIAWVIVWAARGWWWIVRERDLFRLGAGYLVIFLVVLNSWWYKMLLLLFTLLLLRPLRPKRRLIRPIPRPIKPIISTILININLHIIKLLHTMITIRLSLNRPLIYLLRLTQWLCTHCRMKLLKWWWQRWVLHVLVCELVVMCVGFKW